MEHDWAHIAARYFNLRDCEFVDHVKHQKDHYVLRAYGERWVLSTAPVDERRLPIAWQFTAMQVLNAAGFWQVRLPYPAASGDPYALHGTHWWTLRWYALSDDQVDWEDDAVVTDAAETLAAMHDAASRARPNFLAPALDPDRLDPFHWSVEDVLDRLDRLMCRFGARHDREQERCLRPVVECLAAEAPLILAAAERHDLVGLTHQDFRRANLRVYRGRIRELWDWDLARVDHTFYDLAFACLQFMGRDCLLPGSPAAGGEPDRPVELALGFVRGYVRARETHELRALIPALLPWYLRYAIVKRILVGNNPRDRLVLLRQVESSPLISGAALAEALAGEWPAGPPTLVMSEAG